MLPFPFPACTVVSLAEDPLTVLPPINIIARTARDNIAENLPNVTIFLYIKTMIHRGYLICGLKNRARIDSNLMG
jgi:hypothetical protein